MRIFTAILLSMLCLVVSAQTHAQSSPLPIDSSIVLLPRFDDGEYETQIIEALSVATRAVGYKPITPADIQTRLAGTPLAKCKMTLDCDPDALMKALDARAVASYLLFRQDGKPASFGVEIIRADRAQGYEGGVNQKIAGRSLPNVVKTMLAAALAAAEVRTKIDVLIDSRPSHLRLIVDQVEAVTPAKVPLRSGSHDLQLIKDNTMVLRETFTVPENVKSFEHMAVVPDLSIAAAAAQQPVGVAETQNPMTSSEPRNTVKAASPLNYVLGGAAAAVGVLMLIKPINTLVHSGECDSHIGSACNERVKANTATYVHSVVGGLAVLGGVGLMVFAPIRVEVQAGNQNASISVEGTF